MYTFYPTIRQLAYDAAFKF